ncbi:MAG: glycosyltransferase family 4 protein [Theionarchaea archaeon]|nr:glycosyltransferase family 4 protein [Theionarchaea archaeon]
MQKVLFIAYLYPPLNCGVCRQSKISKYLPSCGWMPLVLSVKKSRLRPRYDESLLKDTESITVCRTFSFESRILMRGIPRLLNINPKYLQIPDPFIGWLPFAVAHGLTLIRKENIEAIFSTSMPNTSHLIALILKKMTKLPWLADFREAWTQNPFVSYPAPVFSVENMMEAAVMRNADAITVINDPIRIGLEAKYPNELHKFVTISHGFDPDDFHRTKRTLSQEFTILYAGSLYGRRSAEAFLKVLKKAVEENGELRGNVRIHFVGDVKSAQKVIEKLNLTDIVTLSGYVSHEKIFENMVRADLLLLIIGAEKDDDKISTGKLFEYMGSGTPVLAVAPPGAAAEVVEKAQIGIVVHPNDENEIKKTILRLYQEYKEKKLRATPNKKVVEQYDVRNLSEKVATVLDTITKNSRSNKGD